MAQGFVAIPRAWTWDRCSFFSLDVTLCRPSSCRSLIHAAAVLTNPHAVAALLYTACKDVRATRALYVHLVPVPHTVPVEFVYSLVLVQVPSPAPRKITALTRTIIKLVCVLVQFSAVVHGSGEGRSRLGHLVLSGACPKTHRLGTLSCLARLPFPLFGFWVSCSLRMACLLWLFAA